jgi:hypothetical protein
MQKMKVENGEKGTMKNMESEMEKTVFAGIFSKIFYGLYKEYIWCANFLGIF